MRVRGREEGGRKGGGGGRDRERKAWVLGFRV